MHLFVLHHGLWGNTEDLKFIQIKLEEIESILVLNIQSNARLLTYEGVEHCSSRAVSEIQQFIKLHPSINLISFVGYSLGGIFLRHVIGDLYNLHIFKSIKPHSFTTFATPHLGSRRMNEFFFNRSFNFLSSFFVAQTGLELNLDDSDKGDTPILLRMTVIDSCFMKGLKLFTSRNLYANTRNDFIVKVNIYCLFIKRQSTRLHLYHLQILTEGISVLDRSMSFTLQSLNHTLKNTLKPSTLKDK